MEKKHKILSVALFFVVLIFPFFFSHKPALVPELNQPEFKNIKFSSGVIINAEIVDTPEKQVKGLSGQQSLAEQSGMLFVFEYPDYYPFWMKEMNFGLDFVWIRGNEILEITKNVKLEDYQSPRTLVSKNKADKVLEVNAGTAERFGIKAGDKVEF